MRSLFSAVLCALLITFGQTAHANEIPVIESPVRIPIGQSHEFEFGTVPQRNTTVLLKIHSRLDTVGLGGSMYFLQIRLNGQVVQPAKSRTATRLVNKPLISPVAPDIPFTWYDDKSGWRTLFAPDFTAALDQKFYAGNPYELILDVTDLTNPAAENRLEITNTATESTKLYSGASADLVIGQLSVETKPVPSIMMSVADNPPPFINRGEPAAGASIYRGQVLSGGGFFINTGENTFIFNSAFSYPNAGFNHFSEDKQSKNQSGWRVNVNAKENRVFGQGLDYRVVRAIKFGKTHVEIVDTITNLHKDAPLGLAVRNEMNLTGIKNPQIRIAGNPDPAISEGYAPGNPSVHVRLDKSGIGIIAEDDVFRNQAYLYTKPSEENAPAVAGIRTDMLRLAPGETYALRWAVYPVAGPDYYDFVNLVRDDWKANFTVLGGWWWGFDPDAVLETPLPKLRDLLIKNGISYAIVGGGWIDRMHDPKHIGFGTGVFDDYFSDFRRRIREAGEKLRQARPDIKEMAYYDSLRDSSENSQQKFPDSAYTNKKGEQDYTDWDGLFSRSYTMAPTLQNSFGKAMLKASQRYFDDMKLDGIYWDEMSQTGWDAPWITYNTFDGHSCQLDPETWTTQREVGVSTLVTLPFRMAMIDIVKKNQGVLLGNGVAGTKNEMQTGMQRMLEAFHNDAWPYQANLGTPLGYIGSYNDWKSFLRTFDFAMLPVPTITTDSGFPHDINPYLFPFTPIELHSGYMLGKERIIATHSGNYGWKNERTLAQVFYFDSQGKITPNNFVTLIGSEARTPVALKEKEAIVLERLPLRFEPAKPNAKWQANASQIHSDATGFSLHLNAPTGGVLVLEPGVLPTTNAATVAVQIGSAPARKIQVSKVAVRVPVSPKFSGEIRITK